MTALPPTPLLLTAFGLPHAMGYLETADGKRAAPPLPVPELIRRARELGLSGVEVPLDALADDELRRALGDHDAQVLVDLPRDALDADPVEIRGWLSLAADLGSPVVRTTLSHVLCGDRRGVDGGWPALLARRAEQLRAVLPHAERVGVCIAVENHQDASSDDLLWLAEQLGHSPSFGVTLDAGNPLAVAEDPLEFAERLSHLVRHVHLKDYTLHFAPEGFRLVRCAAGDGVVDFPGILGALSRSGHRLRPGVEIAAQATRTVPCLEDGWWAQYPASQRARWLPVLRLLWQRGLPRERPYSSAWERGESSAVVVAEEWELVRRSVGYFQQLLSGA